MNYIKDVARGLQLRILNGTIMQGENDNRSIQEKSNPSCIQREDISPVYRPKLNHRPIQGEGNNTSVQREHVGCVHQRHITHLYWGNLNNTCIQREGTYTGRHHFLLQPKTPPLSLQGKGRSPPYTGERISTIRQRDT